ncbi:MAG TPA: glycosyltransferase 87 family protein [Terracidiphilus sp.]|nr:glycosyltransferase 87 family protein [Terracidiphilus sp.]
MSGALGRKLGAAAIVVAGFCILGLFYANVMQGKQPGLEGDYIGYWASAQQLVHRANPFDPAALQRLETAAGYDRVAPSITPSPPVTFLLLVPLGFAGAWTGLILWGMAMVAALAASLWMLWQLNGHPDSLLPLLGLLYAPALACFLGGQIGLFFLLGVTVFLYLVDRHPFLAGMVLLPCVMKPHLFLALAVALLCWSLDRHIWSVLAGLAAALAVSTAVTLALDPRVFAHYAASLRATNVGERVTPTLPVLLRHTLAPGASWLEFLPAALSCVWAVWFYARRRARWSWMYEGLIVLLVARLCAPYAWFSDEAILLPAIATAFFRARAAHRAVWPIALIFAAELAQVFARMDMKTYAYAWTAPAWLLCWLLVMPQKDAPRMDIHGA